MSGLTGISVALAPGAAADDLPVVYDSFGGTGSADGSMTESGGKTWQALNGAWTRTGDGTVTTGTGVAANPMLVTDVGSGNIDARVSTIGSSGESAYFRVQDASNWLRARIRHHQVPRSVYPTEYQHTTFTDRQFTRTWREYESNHYTIEKQWQDQTWERQYKKTTSEWSNWAKYDQSACQAAAGDVALPDNTSTTQYRLANATATGCTGGKKKWDKQRRTLETTVSTLWLGAFTTSIPAGFVGTGAERYVNVGAPYWGVGNPLSGSTWGHEIGSRWVYAGLSWSQSAATTAPDTLTGNTRFVTSTDWWTLLAKAWTGYNRPCDHFTANPGSTISCSETGLTRPGDVTDPYWDLTPCSGCATRQSATPTTVYDDAYRIYLDKSVSGAVTNLGSWPVGTVPGFRVTAQGPMIKVFSGSGAGTQVGAISDSSFADATRHGCGLGGADTLSPGNALTDCSLQTMTAPAPVKMMVVGDSISQGLEGDFTWRYRLKQHLDDDGVVTDFVGPRKGTYVTGTDAATPAGHAGGYRPAIDGSFTDTEHLAQWGWQLGQAKWDIASRVSTYTPDYLLVELGFNDIAWSGADAAGLVSGLREFVTNARAAKPDIKILVGNVVHRTALDVQPDLPQRITAYNNALPAAVSSMTTAASPVALVNLDSGYNPAADTYDGLHPNVRGEVVIAKAFADVLSGDAFGVGTGYGAVPTSLPADFVPAKPAAPTVTPSGLGLKVTWPHVFGAGGYQLYQRNVSTGAAWTPYIYPIGAESWSEPQLPAGQEFQFKLKALRGNAAGEESGIGAHSVAPLGAVSNLQAITEPDRQFTVKLSWDPVEGAEEYRVYSAPSCGSTPPAESDYTLVQYGLTATTWRQEMVLDECLTYAVVAARWGGEGPKRTVQAHPRGPAPDATTLTVTPGDGSGLLSWVSRPWATGYAVSVRNATDDGAWDELPIPLVGTSWTLGGLLNGGDYQVRLQSMNGSKRGGVSNVVTFSPQGATARAATLTANPGLGKLNLTWTSGTNANRYEIWLQNVAIEGSFKKLPIPITGLKWTLDDLVAGATYKVKLRSLNGYQAGEWSNVETVVVGGVGPDPIRLSIDYPQTQIGRITWQADPKVTSYQISVANGDPITVGADVRTFTCDAFRSSTPALVRVWAYNGTLRSQDATISCGTYEYHFLDRWMAGEINDNAESNIVTALQASNSSLCQPVTTCKANAYALWAAKVGPHMEWDHKDYISAHFGGTWQPIPSKEPGLANSRLFYDVWSNIHYGQIGRCAGFSEWELVEGQAHVGTWDAGDALSIQLGFQLYNQYGCHVTPAQLNNEISYAMPRYRELGKIDTSA
ncbi:GDSL-type esterase/lipase family protein [Nocardioides hankookensis]